MVQVGDLSLAQTAAVTSSVPQRRIVKRPHVPPHDLLVLGAPALLFPAGHVPLVRQPALNRPA
jgi:hypothetical protein